MDATSTRWLDDDQQKVWRAFLDGVSRIDGCLDAALRPFGLDLGEYEILVRLSEEPDRRMRMSDLARATLQSKSRLSHQITRMENAGLVRRQNCESDRRGLYAVMTDEGWRTMKEVAPHHVAAVREHFVDLLSTSALADLYAALSPVADHLRGVRGRA